MPSPARRRAMYACVTAGLFALWVAPRAGADDTSPVDDDPVTGGESTTTTTESPATTAPEDPLDGEADPLGPGRGHRHDNGCSSQGQDGDRGTSRCDGEPEEPVAEPESPPVTEPPPPTTVPDDGGTPTPAPEPSPSPEPSPQPSPSHQPSADAPSSADASSSSHLGAAAPPPAPTAPGSETAPVASPPTPGPAPAGGGATLEAAAEPLSDGAPVDLLPGSDQREGDHIRPLLWILVPLVVVAGAAVGATAWALRPLVSRMRLPA